MVRARLPAWVEKHKAPGIAIEKRGDRYYASRVTSKWDPKKKRARKITLEYLGVVTPEGIQPPRHKRPQVPAAILEAGHLALLKRLLQPLEPLVLEYFPESGESLLALAALKLCYPEPLKRMKFRHETSLASRLWPGAALQKDSLTNLMRRVGSDWGSQRSLFERLANESRYLAIDLTHVFSQSENIPWIEMGHSSAEDFEEQLAILLIWGVDAHRPAFLQLLPGAVASAQALASTIVQSRLQNVTIMGDKAFYGKSNVEKLENAGIHYILPLKRDIHFVTHPPASEYKEYFAYRKSVQWHRTYEVERRVVHQYLDKKMAADDEAHFLEQVRQGKRNIAELAHASNQFGTLTLLTDTGLDAKACYEMYKNRREIEYAFDALKNTLEADRSWMQSRESLQGYLFVLFLSLYLYSSLLELLRRKELLSEYSVSDILAYLSKVYVVRVGERDVVGVVTRQTQRVIAKLDVPITEAL